MGFQGLAFGVSRLGALGFGVWGLGFGSGLGGVKDLGCVGFGCVCVGFRGI